MNEVEGKRPRYDTPASTVLIGILVVIFGGYFLQHTYMVTMPVACGFFFFCLVRPIQRWFDQRLGDRHGWVGLFFATTAFIGLFTLVGWSIWLCVELIAKLITQYAGDIAAQWKALGEWAAARGVPMDEVTFKSATVRESLLGLLTAGFSSFWQGMGAAVLIFFVVVLMLLEARAWRRKSRMLFSTPRSNEVLAIIREMGNRLRLYMWLRTGISLITGLVSWLWLWAVGVPEALVFGVIIFALNYIPYLGSNVAVIPPALVAWVELGSWRALVAFMGMAVIQQVVGNLIEPRLQGRVLELSPLVIFVSLLYWWWVWGIIGAVLAIPMTVIAAIICLQFEALRPVAILMGSPPKDRRYHTAI